MTRTIAFLSLLMAASSSAQEAESGFDLTANVTAQIVFSSQLTAAPRNGGGAAAGLRAMVYPTWKLSRNWTFWVLSPAL